MSLQNLEEYIESLLKDDEEFPSIRELDARIPDKDWNLLKIEFGRNDEEVYSEEQIWKALDDCTEQSLTTEDFYEKIGDPLDAGALINYKSRDLNYILLWLDCYSELYPEEGDSIVLCYMFEEFDEIPCSYRDESVLVVDPNDLAVHVIFWQHDDGYTSKYLDDEEIHLDLIEAYLNLDRVASDDPVAAIKDGFPEINSARLRKKGETLLILDHDGTVKFIDKKDDYWEIRSATRGKPDPTSLRNSGWRPPLISSRFSIIKELAIFLDITPRLIVQQALDDWMRKKNLG